LRDLVEIGEKTYEDTEEDRNHLVTFEIVGATGFEEDVCFIEEQDGVPFADHVED
jgi:hypothetical protein